MTDTEAPDGRTPNADTPPAADPSAAPPPPGPDSPADGTPPAPNDQGDDPEPRSEEAKRYRLRLRDTESQLQTARDHLEANRQSLVDVACTAAKLDRRLWDAAGVDLAEYTTETGALDLDELIGRAQVLRREMVGGPRPNPQQGGGNNFPAEQTGWATVLNQARKQ